MKKLIAVLPILYLCVFSLFSQTYYVSSSTLNLRSSPEINTTNIIKTLKQNDKVEVIETTNGWSKVNSSGYEGYVSNQYLTPGSTILKTGQNVIICNSETAYAYHKYRCSGLNRCTHSESTILESEAKGLGKTPCKICYSSSGSSSTGNSGSSTYTKPPASSESVCSSVQCSGITQKGLRCKNRTTNCNGRCYHH